MTILYFCLLKVPCQLKGERFEQSACGWPLFICSLWCAFFIKVEAQQPVNSAEARERFVHVAAAAGSARRLVWCAMRESSFCWCSARGGQPALYVTHMSSPADAACAGCTHSWAKVKSTALDVWTSGSSSERDTGIIWKQRFSTYTENWIWAS